MKLRKDKDTSAGIRMEEALKPLLRNIDVEDRYPLIYEESGYLDQTRKQAGGDVARAIGNGSIDEASVGIFAKNVVGASFWKTVSAYAEQEAKNEEILHALDAAEKKQIAYLKAVRNQWGATAENTPAVPRETS